MKRRDHLKGLMLLPLAANPLSNESGNSSTSGFSMLSDPKDKTNIFQSIGVEPIINCRGTFTIIGGSIERPEVRAAMEAASKDFVQYDELADGIGKRLAELTSAEWGVVSSGCAAGMKHVTAACVTGGNPEKLIRIPDLRGFDKTEVIVPKYSRNFYDHALRNIGVEIITVENAKEFQSALCSRTAMIYLMAGEEADKGDLSLEEMVKMAKPWNVPILVDAAAEVLTIPCVHLQRGADVVVYSGGKAICGPQCAGLILGRKDILMSAWQSGSPHHGPGRDNKVGREEMMGMLAAVEAWKTRDHAAEWKRWLSWLDVIAKRVTQVNGITTSIKEPTELSNRSPSLTISWDPAKSNITGEEIADELGHTKPRIAIGGRTNGESTSVTVTTGQMQPGQEKIVAERLFTILSQQRAPKSSTMAAAGSNVAGRWDVTVEFFNSKSQHAFVIEQDGNWLQGTHQGEFTTREMVGTIEGDEIKLRSVDRRPGDSVMFIFSGKVTGDSVSGQIYMGEYRTAKFSAQRHVSKARRERIVVPSGPPLAT